MTKNTNISIYDYLDYRTFLSAYYKAEKERNPKFSYRYFAKKAGISAGNLMHMIISGERNLTKTFLPKFSKALKLNKDEQEYFEALVSYNHVDDPDSKHHYFKLLNKFRKDRPGKRLESDKYEFISTWYYPVIHELVSLPHFKEDPCWIVKMLGGRVTKKQVEEALELLERLGMVERENGKLRQIERSVVTEDEVSHMASIVFHQQMMTLAKQDLQKSLKGKNREISALTMAVSRDRFKEIKRRIVAFQDDLIGYMLEEEDLPESVIQFNFQLFALTKWGDEE